MRIYITYYTIYVSIESNFVINIVLYYIGLLVLYFYRSIEKKSPMPNL